MLYAQHVRSDGLTSQLARMPFTTVAPNSEDVFRMAVLMAKFMPSAASSLKILVSNRRKTMNRAPARFPRKLHTLHEGNSLS